MSSPRRSDQEHESAPDEDHLTFVDNRILDTKTIRLSADELREAVGDFWEGEDGESDDDALAPTPEELGMSREEMWLAELERPEMWYDKLLKQPDTPQVAPKVSRSDLRGRHVYTPWTPPEPPVRLLLFSELLNTNAYRCQPNRQWRSAWHGRTGSF